MPLTKPQFDSFSVSPTIHMSQLSQSMIEKGRKIYKCGFGQSPFPVPAGVVAALRQHAGEKAYLPVAGLLKLREFVAAYESKKNHNSYSADNILIGPGSKELIFTMMMVLDADVMVPSPSWVSYAPQAKMTGNSFSWLATGSDTDWLLTPGLLEKQCLQSPSDKTKVLVLNNPHNPTGRCYSAEQLKQLAAVARLHEMVIISDEIYAELSFVKSPSIAEFYSEGTIVTGGMSKWCGAGGWRLGTAVIPEQLNKVRTAALAVASETYSAVAAPIQYAAAKAYQMDREIIDYIGSCRDILSSLGKHLSGILREIGLEVAQPEGGFYLFVDFTSKTFELASRGIHTGQDLSEQLLLSAGIATVPASAFGCAAEKLVLRVAYVNFDGEKALAAKDGPVDIGFLEQYCDQALDMVQALAAWLE